MLENNVTESKFYHAILSHISLMSMDFYVQRNDNYMNKLRDLVRNVKLWSFNAWVCTSLQDAT